MNFNCWQAAEAEHLPFWSTIHHNGTRPSHKPPCRQDLIMAGSLRLNWLGCRVQNLKNEDYLNILKIKVRKHFKQLVFINGGHRYDTGFCATTAIVDSDIQEDLSTYMITDRFSSWSSSAMYFVSLDPVALTLIPMPWRKFFTSHGPQTLHFWCPPPSCLWMIHSGVSSPRNSSKQIGKYVP